MSANMEAQKQLTEAELSSTQLTDSRISNGTTNGENHNPYFPAQSPKHEMVLELRDGSHYRGYSFGAFASTAGELVFQTGMVGYPESNPDPSSRGQILVMPFPLVGNYGVPSRDRRDSILDSLPAYFESSQIQISGLVIASYAGEEYSHYLADTSLGNWLGQHSVPAMYGVDTRALTKKIREQGSMLGKLRPNRSYKRK